MINYKEFYVWLEGFMTNRNWTEIREIDIETIKEKMKEVSETPNINKLNRDNYSGIKRELLGENWNTHPFKPVGPKIIFHNGDQDTGDSYERYD
jgi:hypothetical protein